MRVYLISLFNLFTLQELRLGSGIRIEFGIQELRSKFVCRNWDRNWATGNGMEIGLQELRSKLLTVIEIEVGDKN